MWKYGSAYMQTGLYADMLKLLQYEVKGASPNSELTATAHYSNHRYYEQAEQTAHIAIDIALWFVGRCSQKQHDWRDGHATWHKCRLDQSHHVRWQLDRQSSVDPFISNCNSFTLLYMHTDCSEYKPTCYFHTLKSGETTQCH